MTECRWRFSVDECQRRKFSAKNPVDMLKLGSVASMGLPKAFDILRYSNRGPEEHNMRIEMGKKLQD